MNDKQELRKRLKALRSQFAGKERLLADEAIFKNFTELCGKYQSFFLYNSFASEASTKLILQYLQKAGKRVYMPKVEGDNMFAVPYGGKMQAGAFGIEEPSGQAFAGDIEVTVIPLLAVNSRLYRIGYGKGYYDRYLQGRTTLKVGLGYGFQKLEFEEDGWDIPLDCFICEKGVYGK